MLDFFFHLQKKNLFHVKVKTDLFKVGWSVHLSSWCNFWPGY